MCPTVQFALLSVLQPWFFGHYQLGFAHYLSSRFDPTLANDLFGISAVML